MANKDVELRIRARDYSQQTLKSVTKAIKGMADVQEQQRKAAERGEVSTRELENAYKKLESAGSQLLKLNSVIEVFKRQNLAMTEAAAKTEALRAKQTELQNAYNATSNVTAKQERDLARVNRQVESAVKAQDRQTERLKRASEEMTKYGIDTAKLGSAQAGIVSSVAQVNAVLERQDNIINNSAAAAAQAKVVRGLQMQADQAMATARGYQTLGRVVQVATGQIGPLGTQIQAIVSPAEAARRSLSGIESQINDVSSAIAKNSKEVVGLAQKVRDLNAANKSISGLAQQIDLFRQQVSAIRAARNEFQAAKREVTELANKMRTASTDTGELGIKMQAAQQRMAAASAELRRTGDAARSTQQALRAAGIDTRNLAAAEDRLINSSKQSTSALERLTAATEKNSKATRDGGKAFSFFRDEGRTTLSMIQRIRGEIIGLTTAYVGFQGAINLAGGAIDAYKIRQQAMVKIGVVVGNDTKALTAEWEYMQGLANKLGIEIETVAQSYTKFAVAANAVGLKMDQTKLIYESVAKAGRVYHLSADDMNGVFRAMEQMLSKGQVYAEELKGQLGERLPGAVAMFAKGRDTDIPGLLKLMEEGKIDSQEVVNFAKAQAKEIDAQVDIAAKGVDAMEARAHNAMISFKLALADSGFIEAYVVMLERITKALSSPDGKEGAKKLGQAFTFVADAVVYLVDNMDTVINVLSILAGLKVTGMVIGFGKSLMGVVPLLKQIMSIGDGVLKVLTGFGGRMAAAGGAATLLGTALKGLARAIPIVGWALLAYSIGEIFYEQSQTFREAVHAVERDFKHLANQLMAIGNTLPSFFYDMAVGIARPVTTMFADTTKQIMNWIADVLSLIPGVGEGLAEWARSVSDDLTKDQRDAFESTKQIWNDVDKKWVQLNDDMVKKNSAAAMQIVDNMNAAVKSVIDAGNGKSSDGFKFQDPDAVPSVGKRDREIKELTKELEKMEAAAKKADLAAQKASQRKNLKGRLGLIDEEFAPQYARAKTIGGAEGDKITKQLDAIVAARKKAESTLFASQNRTTGGIKKQENALDNLIKKYNELNAAVGVKEAKIDPNATFDDRLAAKLQAVNAQYDALIKKANKLGAPGKKVAGDFEDLRKRNLEYATTQAKLEELKRVEDDMNAQQETRSNLLSAINSKLEAGAITEQEAIEQTRQVYADMNGQINDTAMSLEQLAIRFKDTMSAEEFSRLMSQIAAVQGGLTKTAGLFTNLEMTAVKGALDGMSTALQSVKDEMVGVIIGAQSIGDAFVGLGVTVAKFFADFLMQIAQAILQQALLNAIAGMGGGTGAAAVSLGGKVAPKKHNGGVIGSSAGGQQRANGISPALFANAPRFHTGGLPGLKSDEVPTILQKGEEVLSKNDPDNILNGGRGRGDAPQQQAPNMRFVLVDDRSRIPEAMNTPEGEVAIMQILRQNQATLKQLIK